MIALFLNFLLAGVFILIGAFIGRKDSLQISATKTIIYLIVSCIVIFCNDLVAIGFNSDFLFFFLVFFNIGFWFCYKDYIDDILDDLTDFDMPIAFWRGTCVMLLTGLVYFTTSSEYLNDESFKDIGNIEVTILEAEAIDTYYLDYNKDTKERIPALTAYKKAELLLSTKVKNNQTLGSVFSLVPELHSVQKIEDTYYHVFALKYNNWSSQGSYGGIDKYIVVDAYNFDKDAILIESGVNAPTFSMDVSYGGSLSNNAVRAHNSEYLTSDYDTISLVIADNFVPYLAFYNTKPYVGFNNPVNTEIALFDFDKDEFVSFDRYNAPFWLDHKISYNVLRENFNNWSRLNKGYEHRYTNKLVMNESEKTVLTKDGYAIMSEVSSGREGSNEIAYISFINIDTNKITLVKSYGLNNKALKSNINTELADISPYRYLNKPDLIKLDNGEKVWATAILSSSNWKIMGWAISHFENVNLVAIGDTLEEAKNNYIILEK